MEAGMRIGYSLLWGEVFDAADLDYDLTRDLQVACPCCKESVVKVRRPLADGRETHYLAHRRADAERDATCELRVASMGAADFARLRAEGRGQSIAAFLAVFPERLGAYIDKVYPRISSAAVDEVLANPAMRRILPSLAADVRTLIQSRFARAPETRATYLDGSPARRRALGLPAVQRPILEESFRFSDDMLDHLATPQASANLERLVGTAVVTLILRARQTCGMPKVHSLAAFLDDSARAGTYFDHLDVYAAAYLEPMAFGFSKLKADTAHQKLTKVLRPLFPEHAHLGQRAFFATAMHRKMVESVFYEAANTLFTMPSPDVLNDRPALEKADLLEQWTAPMPTRTATSPTPDHDAAMQGARTLH